MHPLYPNKNHQSLWGMDIYPPPSNQNESPFIGSAHWISMRFLGEWELLDTSVWKLLDQKISKVGSTQQFLEGFLSYSLHNSALDLLGLEN